MAASKTPKKAATKRKASPKKKSPTLAELNADLYAARQRMEATQSEVAAARKRLRAAQTINTAAHRIPVVAERQAELVTAQNDAVDARVRFEALRQQVRKVAAK